MKTKLYKIMAIAVTVVMLVSLMVGGFTAPAGAQPPPKPLEWGGKDPGPPGEDGGWFWSGDINDSLGPMEKAIDGSIWLGVTLGGPDAGEYLFKSTDFGRKWSDVDYEGGKITVIACSPEDADVLFVADDDGYVYQTTNGGDRFYTIGLPGDFDDGDITGMSVGYRKDTYYLFVSTENGGNGDVYKWDDDNANWEPQLIQSNRDVDNYSDSDPLKLAWLADTVDVWDVQVSPDYATDRFVVAVATAGVWWDLNDNDTQDAGETWDGTFATYQYRNGMWAADLADAELLENVGGDPTNSLDEVYSASIWLPDGFDSDPEEDMDFFVGIASTANSEEEGDVYRVISSAAFDLDLDGKDSATNVVDLAGAGDAGDAMMVALGNDADTTTMDGYVVYRTDDAGESWDEQKERPTGNHPGRGSVVVADDFADSEECLFATRGNYCGVSLSRDMGETCDQISMIQANDAGGVLSFALDGANTYLAIQGAEDEISLYRNAGSWERVAMPYNPDYASVASESCQVYVSPDGDAVFYLDLGELGTEGDETVYCSTDGGTYFKEWKGKPDQAYCMVAVSKSEAFVGGNGAVYHTTRSGTTWKTYDEGISGVVTQLVMSPDYDADETLVAVAGDKLFKSTDGGEEWKEVKGFGSPGDKVTCVAFHPDYADNGTLFAGGYSGTFDGIGGTSDTLLIYRLGGPDIDKEVTLEGTYGAATGIGLGADGTLYVGAYGACGVLRCLAPMSEEAEDIEWQEISRKFSDDPDSSLTTKVFGIDDPGTLGMEGLGYWLTPEFEVVSGSNVIWGTAWDGKKGPNGGFAFKRYEDTLTGKVILTSPADGSTADKLDRVILSWKAMDGAKRYQVQFDIDPEFNGPYGDDLLESEPTNLDVIGLDDGQTYYWRARVLENKYEEMYSNWSDTWSFTTRLGAGEWNPFVGGVPEAPANGATNVPLDPTFAWNAADWATGYEFILAKDAAFTDVVISKTGANALKTTVYMCEQQLEYSTTYYWKVRGKSNTSASEWATAVFTTIAAPGAPPTAPPTATPTPEPTTPVYIWVIIGIGAALVIAVIVLIVRTRRVA